MEATKLKFWLNLILVIGTTYIVTWYLLTPSNNRCQMTFMMEPPKFLPVPVDDIEVQRDSALNYPNVDIHGSKKKDNSYKLYMYSEFGFPQSSNVRRDLKDSMPVLFVPGNAGSYQQVRSLASTCIRHQLQSLDAFKFIFYTIDFRGQLSGINGQLIEDQTLFVQQSLNQIAKMHPTETNGIILIGHSVGGFISKVLFTLPTFKASTVPLLISLASPLTKPYLTFDDKMRKLYHKTNKYWKERESTANSTIAISISGGPPDRLVPMHLTMDPHFDLALTTSSMKDVWLTTDHVCITWCKELMQKLSYLLSALMDRRETRMISNRDLAISIIKKELLIDINSNNQKSNNVIHKDWKSMRSHMIIEFEEYYSDSRSKLGDSIIILKLNHYSGQDILINIDYIDALKENGVFGCSTVNFNSTSSQLNCLGRSDLMQFSYAIPSRRFEPKRLALKLEYNKSNLINYIVFDFLSYTSGYAKRPEHKPPEMVIVQRLNSTVLEESIYIPSILEYIFKRLLFIDNFHHEILYHKAFPLIYLRYKVMNLKQKTQIYSINYKSHSCTARNHPNDATIVFIQGGYLIESFHPTTSNENTLSVDIKIASQRVVGLKQSPEIQNDQSYLDFYIDGTCKNSLDIELDFLALFVDVIQKSLGKIMTSTTLLAYLSIISSAFNLVSDQQVENINSFISDKSYVIKISSFIFIYAASDHLLEEFEKIQHDNYLDQSISIILIFILSHGVFAFFDYFIKRVIDLAIIINNAQSLIRQKVNQVEVQTATETPSTNGAKGKRKILKNSTKTDFDWLLITLAISGGFMFSPALMSLFTLFIIIKLKLSLDIAHARKNDIICGRTVNKHCVQENVREEDDSKSSHVHDLITNVAVFSVLSLIATIPAALIKINSNKLTSIDDIFNPFYRDVQFLATAFTLILVKVICEVIETIYINNSSSSKDQQSSTSEQRQFIGPLYSFLDLFSTKHLHLLTLVPITMIESNICHQLLAFTISMSWLSGYLLKKNQNSLLGSRKTMRK